jgi:[ribosomal protein S18]-alanine N-acetyltransferase
MIARTLAATHAAAFAAERPWTELEFANLLAQPTTRLFGDGRSFLLARMIFDEAEVLTLATHPDHRRQGLARAALTAFLDEARATGATRTFLDVAEDNTPARALYASAGFTQIARRPAYYTSSDKARTAALVLARDLTAA